ncbi:uncharacterized protein FFB20_14385 [Fusarium fujikuroi]|uniref:Uncharacterized protein n=1 Tax=Fusarium fujikuroi TaxID=5127 RepID=A0A2H3S400_FUSFU|nr:uncharacterized protein FFC1_05424 [Fusarium fujikuroi]SCN92928.1 uncharacterized protein FFE2_07517 [Fusarium fujikuroi]SCO13803.1 uncharacterized protein FFB20_14385 [Fusarium fujikuroi]SCO42276.1 uncharacterized protein FFNC_08431 [Fusarium fujikuroi]SCO42935.1 uncharacterized protein FFMR_07095 [Fusarium fujikuroi]
MAERHRDSYDADVDDVHADNDDPRLESGEQGAALLPPKFPFEVWTCSRSTFQLSDYSQQSCRRRIDIERNLDRDYDRDHDRDDHLQDARAPTSEANIFLSPTETYRDEAIASPPACTGLGSTTKVTP